MRESPLNVWGRKKEAVKMTSTPTKLTTYLSQLCPIFIQYIYISGSFDKDERV